MKEAIEKVTVNKKKIWRNENKEEKHVYLRRIRIVWAQKNLNSKTVEVIINLPIGRQVWQLPTLPPTTNKPQTNSKGTKKPQQ